MRRATLASSKRPIATRKDHKRFHKQRLSVVYLLLRFAVPFICLLAFFSASAVVVGRRVARSIKTPISSLPGTIHVTSVAVIHRADVLCACIDG